MLPLSIILLACPVERGTVKMAADLDVETITSTAAHPATIPELAALGAPIYDQHAPRSSQEDTLVEVVGDLVGFKLEGDGDIHVVLEDQGATVVVELPSPACGSDLTHRAMFKASRAAFLRIVKAVPVAKFVNPRRHIRLRVRGLVFFDRPHGQSGGAPNAVEVHPVVGVEEVITVVNRRDDGDRVYMDARLTTCDAQPDGAFACY